MCGSRPDKDDGEHQPFADVHDRHINHFPKRNPRHKHRNSNGSGTDIRSNDQIFTQLAAFLYILLCL